jgi:hypothetical protein
VRARDVPKILRLALPAALVIAVAGCSDGDSLAQRQAEVAERGARVMPFDLAATTHTFTKTDDGGIQTVVADDPTDAPQIELIRQHLREERDNFARGDFNDPAAIHGHDMDGVAELRAGYPDITVRYLDRPDGAQLTYHTDRAELVQALHAWFDRQLADHGPDAETGRPDRTLDRMTRA